ncbi:MAG: hypothetical protein ABFS39_08145 [Pseudomonadota bacterium]
MDDSFIDLRLNRQSAQAEESFWPSFTDIMTVIVMIFMLAMVILLIRNMELLNQLRATMEAEQQAVELARSTGAENETLEEKLIAREHELSMLRMQLMRMEEESEQQEAAMTSQRHQIDLLSRERVNLSYQVNQLSQERNNLTNQVERITDNSNRLQTQVTEANQNIENLNLTLKKLQLLQQTTLKDLATLRLSYSSQEEALEEANALTLERDQALAELKTDFDSLEIKYNKLLRPARSARGKTVVEVRYHKTNGKLRIDYKDPGSQDFKSISRNKLDQDLTRLKKKHPAGLYIKVILPKDSGLSYSEAWSFTNHLHQTYDYYYQEEAKKERIISD